MILKNSIHKEPNGILFSFGGLGALIGLQATIKSPSIDATTKGDHSIFHWEKHSGAVGLSLSSFLSLSLCSKHACPC